MPYQQQLLFARQLLSRMQIHTHLQTFPEATISKDIDMGLRAMIFGLEDYASFLQNSMLDAQPNTVYRFFDEYDCKYIFLRLPEEDHFFFVGPYLTSPPEERTIREELNHMGLSEEQFHLVYKFYTTLPILDDEDFLFTLVSTLADCIWGENQYRFEYVEYTIPDQKAPFPFIHQQEHLPEESPQGLELLERIYATENQMIDAVKEGKLHKIATVSSYLAGNSMDHRTADTLRNRKNYLVILKTLLRKAAEYGNVHPIHLDRESSKYAQKIEDARTNRECDQLQQEMIRSFCLLVKNCSLNQYSSLIGKAITIIAYDLAADLRLKTLAE